MKLEEQKFPCKTRKESKWKFYLIATCIDNGKAIPLNAALQFWNPTMAPFVQKIKKLSTLDVFLLDFHNKLIQWRQKDLKLQFSAAMTMVNANK